MRILAWDIVRGIGEYELPLPTASIVLLFPAIHGVPRLMIAPYNKRQETMT